MLSEESTWAKISECKPDKAFQLFSNKNCTSLLVFSKFADTLEVHGVLSKKTAEKFQGLAAHPMYYYAHASIASIKGVANEFEN